MPVTAPQVQLNPRHLSSTTLTAALSNVALQMTVASGAIFDGLPTAALLTDGANVEVISVDSLASGTTYNITRAIEPATAAAAFPANTTQVKIIIAAESFRRLQRGFRERASGFVNVLEYGAKGDGQVGAGSMAASGTTLTLDIPRFTAADVGKWVVLQSAGPSAGPLVAQITAFISTAQVTVAPAASTATSHTSIVWGTDDTASLQAAVNAVGAGRSGRVVLPAAVYMLRSTLTLPGQIELWGTASAQLPLLPGDGDYHSGACLVWAGATNSTMVSLFATQGVLVHGLTLNAEGIPGITGFLIDSVSNPSGQLNTIEHFCCWHCTTGVQWGTSQLPLGSLPPALAGGGYQNDSTILRGFWIAAPTIAAVARGIVVNATNTQASQIEQGIIQSCRIGIYYRITGGFNTVDRVIIGACSDTAILTTPYCGETLLKNVQSEGCTNFLRASNQVDDAGALGATTNAITMVCCHLDNAITVTGGQTIITIGCSASGGVLYTANAPATNIISIGDTMPSDWTMTQGKYWKLGASTGGHLGIGSVPQLAIGTPGQPRAGTVPATLTKHLMGVLSISNADWGFIALGTSATRNITVTGANPGDVCSASPDTILAAGLVWNAYCVANDAVTIRMTNTMAAQQPATANWRATVLGY